MNVYLEEENSQLYTVTSSLWLGFFSLSNLHNTPQDSSMENQILFCIKPGPRPRPMNATHIQPIDFHTDTGLEDVSSA